jgi:hypothetical protein
MKLLNKKMILLLMIASLTGWLFGSWTNAEDLNSTPGSVDDPLVTKSYLDEQVENLVGRELDTMKKAFNQQLTDAIAANQAEAQQDFALELEKLRESAASSQTNFDIVPIKLGQMIVLRGGAEAIVRQGRAQLFSPDANGISNITVGKALLNRDQLVNDHLLVFPRDGRGIYHQPTYSADLIVMVRGGYQIKPMVKP